MHILIFGATGGTGRSLVRQALERGHQVTAFVRDPSRLEAYTDHERLYVVTGDAMSADDVDHACQGPYDAVVCALGVRGKQRDLLRAAGTRHIVEAMRRHLPQARLWVVSSVGVGESKSQLPWTFRLYVTFFLRTPFRDHEQQEAVVRASGLNYVIVRPVGLSDSCRSGDYQVTASGPLRSGQINRADVADFILTNLTNAEYDGQAVSLAG